MTALLAVLKCGVADARHYRPTGGWMKMNVAKTNRQKSPSGTASSLDKIRPQDGWPNAPVAPESKTAIAAWLVGQCQAENVQPATLAEIEGWVFAQGFGLLTNLRANEASPNLAEERARAVKIRGLALSLAGELREVETWGSLAGPLARTGQLRGFTNAGLDNLATVFNLTWQDWGRHSHPLEILAQLAKNYDARLVKLSGPGSPNLFRRRNGDPRFLLARGVRLQLMTVLGPYSAPASDGSRAHTLMRQIWRYATGGDPDRANLLHFLMAASKQKAPQQ